MTAARLTNDRLRSRMRWSLIIGAVALLIAAIGAAFDFAAACQGFLLGFVFWTGVSLGALAILMLSHATGGEWSRSFREIYEAGAETLPLMAVLFIPVALTLGAVYDWADPERAEALRIPGPRQTWLEPGFFVFRSVIYFAIWLLLVFAMTWRPYRGRVPVSARSQAIASFGLVLFLFTGTFAAFDWVMSLNAQWYSTGFGVYLLAGYVLSAVAMSILAAGSGHAADPVTLRAMISTQSIHDLGNLLLVFIMFWSYMSFMQYLIVWSGNVSEDNLWFVERSSGAWKWIGVGLIFLHFFLPFLALLSRRLKRSLRTLGLVAAWVFVMRFIEMTWAVTPAFDREGFWIHWLDIVVPIGVGGLWVAMFTWRFDARLRVWSERRSAGNEPGETRAVGHSTPPLSPTDYGEREH